MGPEADCPASIPLPNKTKRFGAAITEDATEAMLMIDPPPAAIMAGRKARHMRYMAVMFRPLVLVAIEDCAIGNETGAVEQYVERSDLRCRSRDGGFVADIQHPDGDGGAP